MRREMGLATARGKICSAKEHEGPATRHSNNTQHTDNIGSKSIKESNT